MRYHHIYINYFLKRGRSFVYAWQGIVSLFGNEPNARIHLCVALLVVAAGDVRIDNAKYKACFGGKAAMLTPDEAVERVGHAVGGVCPFAVNEGVEDCLDQSLRRFETVLPAAGSANSCIELTLEELERFARTTRWVDVCRPRQ